MARRVPTSVAVKSPLPLALIGLLCFTVAVLLVRPLAAQDQAQPVEASADATDQDSGALDAEALRVLVAPIAFYPDDVLAIVLPAATTGLQIVQAKQLLDKRKTDAKAQPGKDWDPSVIALLNYPDVIARMNADLDWTGRLGDAVINQQSDVMDAIQQIRNEAVASGYLKSDDKQVITQTQETVVIKSADPEVIYVPSYDPNVIIEQTYVTAPPVVYSPPYPYYYSPAATFFTGMFVGAALSYAFDWNHNNIDVHGGDININNSFNRNNNLNKYDINRKPGQNGNGMTWQGNKKRPTTRPATGNRPAGLAPANRPGGINNRPGANGAGQKPNINKGQAQKRLGNQQNSGRGGSLGNVTPNRQTLQQSNRGQQSLQQRQQHRPAPSTSNRGGNRQGAFGGSGGGGGKAMQQQNRGNRSLGGRRR